MCGFARKSLNAALFALSLPLALALGTAPARADIMAIGGSGLDRAHPAAIIFWRGVRDVDNLADLEQFFEASLKSEPVPGHLWPRKVIAAVSDTEIEEDEPAEGANAKGVGYVTGTWLLPDPPAAQQCDWYAAHPDDPDNFGPAVEWDSLEASKAIVACRFAVHLYPRVPRFQFQLARAYEKADDILMAVRLYRLAAANGSGSAMVNLGLMHHAGRGLERDPAKAIKFYESASALGNPGAMYSLGLVYARGLGVEKDIKKAIEWFDKAADHGLTRAMYSLGVLYAGGRAVEEDAAKAVQYFRRAADSGHGPAMNKMGMAYVSGSGVETKDFKIAVEWYRRAAEQKHLPAMYNLGVMASRGWGTPKNMREAAMWFRRGARAGYGRALQKLEETAEVQQMLTELGYDPGPVDGVMGGKTKDAITAFEKKRGLKPTGEPSQPLVKALLAAIKPIEPDELAASAGAEVMPNGEGDPAKDRKPADDDSPTVAAGAEKKPAAE